MMNWIIPPAIHPGDEVALLSPASPVYNQSYMAAGLKQLKTLVLKVALGKFAKQKKGYLAGSDQQRANDFISALKNPAIKAIFCTRGGYGAARLLEQLDPKLLRQYPKALIGYSDITVLHLAYQTQKIVSYWGPLPCTSTGLSTFSKNCLKRICMDKLKKSVPLINSSIPVTVMRHGRAKGRLTGGTLTLLAASIGAWYEIDTKDKIVFIEDTGEASYKVDRLLTQLIAANKLADARAILLGRFIDCSPGFDQSKITLKKVFKERLHPLGIPILTNFPVGHIKNQLILPYGAIAEVDTENRQVTIRPH